MIRICADPAYPPGAPAAAGRVVGVAGVVPPAAIPAEQTT